jgi:hypothetical protein
MRLLPLTKMVDSATRTNAGERNTIHSVRGSRRMCRYSFKSMLMNLLMDIDGKV